MVANLSAVNNPMPPEYQISHASTKAIAASRRAGARDVWLGLVHLPTTLSTRQKTLIKQTKSLLK
jgi:hypothetical protein